MEHQNVAPSNSAVPKDAETTSCVALLFLQGGGGLPRQDRVCVCVAGRGT